MVVMVRAPASFSTARGGRFGQIFPHGFNGLLHRSGAPMAPIKNHDLTRIFDVATLHSSIPAHTHAHSQEIHFEQVIPWQSSKSVRHPLLRRTIRQDGI